MKTNLKRISKRSLALILGILMLISTLMVGSFTSNAATSGLLQKGYIYFDNTNAQYTGTIKICTLQDNYISCETMSPISGTNLYYWSSSTYSSWSLNGFCFIQCNSSGDWGNQEGGYSKIQQYAANYTAQVSNYKINASSTYYFKPSSSSKGSGFTDSNYYKSNGYSDLNATQTVKPMVSTDGGNTWTEDTLKSTITASRVTLTGNGTSSSSNKTLSDSSCYATSALSSTVTFSSTGVNDDYEFAGWGTVSTGPTSTETSYSYSVSGDTTVYAYYVKQQEQTYTNLSATVNDSNGGSATIDPDNCTIGSSVTVTATKNDGYTFTGWTSDKGTFANASALSTTFTPSASGAVATANFTENLYTVTVTNGTPTSVQAGVTTKPSITASDKSGYTFKEWTVTGGASVASATSATTTVSATSAGTVTATYTFNSSSGYYLKGEGGFDGENWSTSNTANEFKYSESDTNNATLTLNLTADTYYQFKVYSTSSSTWYGGGTTYNSEENAITGTTTVSSMSSNQGSDNIYVKATETGVYTLSFSKSSPHTLTITYPAATKYRNLSATVNDANGGSVDIGATSCDIGSSVTVTATPKTGYSFTGWTSDNGSFANASALSTTFTPNSDGAVATANFTENLYTVTVTDGTPASVSAGVTTKPQITATSKSGYTFKEWTVTGGASVASATSATTTVTATAAGTVTATYTRNQYTGLSATAGTGGTASISAKSVNTGESVTVTAVPADGYEFVNWTSDKGSFTNATALSTAFTPTANNAVAKANFKETTYKVTLVNGTVASVNAGKITPVSITAADKTGYRFTGWTTESTGITIANASSKTTTITATSAGTVTANYVQQFTVTPSAGSNGTVKVNDSTSPVTVDKNSSVSVAVTPNDGYEIASVKIGGVQQTVSDKSSFTTNITVTADTTVEATFAYKSGVVSDTYIHINYGGWVDWNLLTTSDPNVVTYTAKLDSGTYAFKICENGTWLGNNGTIVDTTTTTSSSGWDMESDKGDCKLQASGGTYTFTYKKDTNKLIIEYSANPTLTDPTLSVVGEGPFYVGDNVKVSAVFDSNTTTYDYTIKKDGVVVGTASTGNAVAESNIIDIATALSGAGEYEVSVTAKASGYNDATKSITFTVNDFAQVYSDKIDYSISNTWIAPGTEDSVLVTLKKGYVDPAYIGKTIKLTVILTDESSLETSVVSDTEYTVTDTDGDGVADKISNAVVSLPTTLALGKYNVSVKVDLYDGAKLIGTGSYADPTRVLTVSNDDPKVDLTARLKVTNYEGTFADENNPAINVEQGETITLNGFCNNGNKPAGDYTEKCATSYVYNYYYYTTDANSPTRIKTITDSNPAAAKPVTSTTTTFTVPEDDTLGTVYHFYVTITAQLNGVDISDPASSEVTGKFNATVIAPTVKVPKWVEDKVYVHTIGDNTLDREAWTVIEPTASNLGKDGRPSLGSYSSASAFQVFLPESAKNSDNTYTVFNNRSTSVTIGSTTINSGETANVPASQMTSMMSKTLTVYTSKAEENVFISHNDATVMKDGTTSVSDLSTLINEMYNKSSKSDAVVGSPSITLVQSSGKVDISETAKQVKGRGNTTWTNTGKKSWNFTLNTKTSVCGMDKGKKYSLLANFQDPSLSRNRFLLDLADSVGVKYSSDSRYSDVYVDGLYVGSYLLTQKYDSITNISDPTIDAEGNIDTSSLEFMIELAGGTQGDDLEITPASGGILSVTLPDPADLTTAQQEQAAAFIKEKFETLYSALTNSNTSYDELNALIDVPSLAKAYLIQELGKNYDSGVSSFYLVYEGGKFYAAPVWDFDNSLGNPNTSPTEAPDYKQPSGWWCKYWKGYSNGYNGNFIYNAANSKLVMNAAKAAWFGTGTDDTTSFVYNINKFASESSTTAKLTKNTGLINKDYYKNVVTATANNNYVKWPIEPSAWCQGHDSITMYQLADNFYTDIVDYSTYKVKTNYDSAYDSALTNTTYNYYYGTIDGSGSDKPNGGQYDYAADYMISRAAWMSYNFLDTSERYYVVGSNYNTDGVWSPSPSEYKMTEKPVGSGIYVYENQPIGNVSGSSVYFKIANGSAYIGPSSSESDEELTSGTIDGTDVYKSTTASFGSTKAYYLTTAPSWEYVDICYNSITNVVYLRQHVDTTYTAPEVSISPATQFVDSGEEAKITAEITTPTKVNSENYTGNYVFELRSASGLIETKQASSKVTFTFNNFEDGKYEYSYFVKVYPAADESASAQTDNVTVEYMYQKDTADVTFYVDMHSTGAAPTINFSNGTSASLTQVDSSTVYSGTASLEYYKDSSGTPKQMVSRINDITAYDKSFTVTSVLDAKCITTGEAWIEATEDISSKVAGSGASETTSTKSPTSDTVRIYFAQNGYHWTGDMYVHIWNSTTNEQYKAWQTADEKMTLCPNINGVGQRMFYYDIPKSGYDKIVFSTSAYTTANGSSSNGQSADTNLDTSTITATSGNYFYNSNDNTGGKTEVSVGNCTAPTFTQYVDNITLFNTSTDKSIAPTVTGTVSYSGYDTSIINVSDSGVITPVAVGKTSVTVTVTGDYGDTTTQTTNVNVVDQGSSKASAYDIMSYNSGVATFSAKNGTVGTITTTVAGSKYASPSNVGIVTTADGVKTVKYAVADSSAYTDLLLTVNVASTGNTNYIFDSWTKDGINVADSIATQDFALDSTGTVSYVAVYVMNNSKYVIKYNFNDFDTSKGYEYAEGQTKAASYTTGVVDVLNGKTNSEIVTDNAPNIISNYFDYTPDMSSITTNTDENGITHLTVSMTETAKTYSVAVNTQAPTGGYHYMEEVDLAASDYDVEAGSAGYKWTDKSINEVVSDKETYTLRVSKNTELLLEPNDDSEIFVDKSVINYAYKTITAEEDGTEKLCQNFYIQDFYRQDDAVLAQNGNVVDGATDKTFEGAGVLYYVRNDSRNTAVSNTVKTFLKNNSGDLKSALATVADRIGVDKANENNQIDTTSGLNYSFVKNEGTTDDVTGLTFMKYSQTLGCYSYFFQARSDYDKTLRTNSYVVYSYFVYSYKDKDGNTKYTYCISDTSAEAKVYE
ncbi:MAG: CotH kinase family protein [Ruminococcus sp.]